MNAIASRSICRFCRNIQSNSLSTSAPTISKSFMVAHSKGLRHYRALTTFQPSVPSTSSEPLTGPLIPSASTSNAHFDHAQMASPAEGTINLTSAATKHIEKIQTRESNPSLALRVAVDSGGCYGYTYKLEIADTKELEDDDRILTFPSRASSNPVLVVVDALSLSLVKGATIDFVTELIGSTFRISDNPQAKGSGCGCGVSWELKDDLQIG